MSELTDRERDALDHLDGWCSCRAQGWPDGVHVLWVTMSHRVALPPADPELMGTEYGPLRQRRWWEFWRMNG